MKHTGWMMAVAALAAAVLVPATGASASASARGSAAQGLRPASATQLWAASYHGPGTEPSSASSVAVSPDGSMVFVTGTTNATPPNGAHGAATVAYDAATGAQVWVQQFASPRKNGQAGAESVTVSPDGATVYVVGTVSQATGPQEFVTIAYDAATGTQKWEDFYGLDRALGALFIRVSPDGSTVFVAGNTHFTTVAYDAATGAQLWTARYAEGDGTESFAVSPDGSRVFVTGWTAANGSAAYATVAFDAATGAQLWVRQHGQADNAMATSLAVSPDSSTVFVTGQSEVQKGQVAIAYSATTGAVLWSRATRFAGTSVLVSPDGTKVFVLGFENVGNSDDFITAAYDATTGAQLWTRRYGPPSTDANGAVAGAVSADGSEVFVTGESQVIRTTELFAFATVAYDAATGAQEWTARFGRSLDAIPVAMALSQDGTGLFITGAGAGEYQTVAYHP